ncbi:hypothetical protein PhCBS80983_g05013 [Powellomyces hirtus]|uniref:Protein kinase domain-containing protein n=1 Tax=Powellomyces hirtus TaxID=109895 RepID=A0A507DXW2_9FUNG|nr:hypothetical protein PhCBS80983_g05013 [Powellomyces hirtus]
MSASASPRIARITINTSKSAAADASAYIKASIAHTRTDDSIALEAAYSLGAKLGQGSFGTVRLVQHKETNTTYACKIMRKRRGDPRAYEQIQREVAIMKRVRHAHIIQLKEVFETPKQFFLIMEYCKGGELVQRVKSRRHCSEADVRIIIQRLVEAIAYLHDQGIVHRDIKPENILVSADPMSADPENGNLPDLFNIKVSDFGLATFTDACNMMENIVGTPLYMAPEIVQNLGYSAQCDLWSIGVMMYLLLCGYRPEVERALNQMIQEGQIAFRDADWKDISPGARNLVESILRIDPAKRITAREVLMHPWLNGEEAATPSASTVLDLMRSYNAERRFRRVAHAVIAFIRFRTVRGDLKSFSPSISSLPTLTSSSLPLRANSRSSLSSVSCESLDSVENDDDPPTEGKTTPLKGNPLAKSMVHIKSSTAKPLNTRSVTALVEPKSKPVKHFTTASPAATKKVSSSLPPKYIKQHPRLPRRNSISNSQTLDSTKSQTLAAVSLTSVSSAKRKEGTATPAEARVGDLSRHPRAL